MSCTTNRLFIHLNTHSHMRSLLLAVAGERRKMSTRVPRGLAEVEQCVGQGILNQAPGCDVLVLTHSKHLDQCKL